MNSESKKLLIISGFLDAKPTGGVTMHVHRLLKQLIEPCVSNYELCDYKKEGFLKQLRKIRKADVAHIHVSNPYLKLIYIIYGKVYKTVSLVMVHGRYGSFSRWKNMIHKWALKLCDVPILINKESYEAVRAFNVRSVFIPAFIPPIEEEEVLDKEIVNRIKKIKADTKPLFVTNASSRAFTDDGREIYGIEFLIDFFAKHAGYNLVILDPQGQYSELHKEGLPANVTIVPGLHSFCGLMELADVVIRNTPIDGDSFTVKEALCYHKRILATDAVSRPDGVFLFKYNDACSLEKAIAEVFDYQGLIEFKGGDALSQYRALYALHGVID